MRTLFLITIMSQVGGDGKPPPPAVVRPIISTGTAQGIACFLFASVVIFAASWMRVRQAISGDAAFKLIGLAVVVGAGLYVISTTFDEQKEIVTPIVGILGT